jgi:hypothetical protein
MLSFLQRRREQRQQVSADAEALVAQFGEGAYGEARQRAREARQNKTIDGNRPKDHWERVRAFVGRRSGRRHVDTATRYLGAEMDAGPVRSTLPRTNLRPEKRLPYLGFNSREQKQP